VPRQLGDVAWPVSTARLTLRRARVDDADAVLSYRSLPSVSEWIGAPPEDFPARFAAPERLDLLLIVERAGAIIGDLMVKVVDAWVPAKVESEGRGVQAELGWSLRPEETGKGYATEAAEAVLDWAWGNLDVARIVSFTIPTNLASQRVMERIGMKRRKDLDFTHPNFAPDHQLHAACVE